MAAMRSGARVSVIVPAYQHEAFIARALTSVLAQTRPADEILVIDDGSRDETAAIVEAMASRAAPGRIILRRQANQGAHAALNTGLDAATGDVLTILNSDDSFAPTRLSDLVGVIERGASVAFSRVVHVDEAGVALASDHPLVAAYDAALARARETTEIGFAILPYNLAVTSGNLVFTRALWRRVGPFAPLRLCHDWDWLLRALLVTEPRFIDQPLLHYRVHGGNATLGLGDVADAEATDCLVRYFRAADAVAPANPRAPSAHHWPAYFERAARDLGVARALSIARGAAAQAAATAASNSVP